MGNFQRLEVVGRGSETQLQVGENLNLISWRVKQARDMGQIIGPALKLWLHVLWLSQSYRFSANKR